MRYFDFRLGQKRCSLFGLSTLLTLLLLTAGTGRLNAQPVSDALPDFSRVDGIVSAVVITNNTAFVGGDFAYVGPPTGPVGLIDPEFGGTLPGLPKLQGTVRTAVSDGAGGWYLGGLFVPVGRPELQNLIHLFADNTLDLSFRPNPDQTVRTLLLLPGALLVGGDFFTIASNQVSSYLAFLDPITGGTNGVRLRANSTVSALAADGDTVYVGGAFSALTSFVGTQQTQSARPRLAAFKWATGEVLPWNPTCSGGFEGVKAIVLNSTTVYVGGDFTQCGSKPRAGIASLTKTDGTVTTWSPNASFPNGSPVVNALALVGNVIYVGGDFTTIGVRLHTRLAALQATGFGQAVPNWQADADDIVEFIVPFGSDLLVGGRFIKIGGTLDLSNPSVPVQTGGVVRRGFARIEQATAAVSDWGPYETSFKPLQFGAANNGTSWTVAVTPTQMLIGGDFASVGGVLRAHIAAIDLTTGAATAWNPNADLTVRTLALGPNGLYAGGTFTNIGGQLRPRLALLKYDSGLADPWDPQAGAAQFVSAVTYGSNAVFVAGQFNKMGGQDRTSLAQLDAGSGNATTWNPQPSGAVNALLYNKGQIYVGGSFFGISGGQQQYLALLTERADAPNPLVKTFNPQPDGQVRALGLSADNRLFVAGDFSKISNQDRKAVAAIDPVTGLEPTPLDVQVTGTPQVRAMFPLGTTVYMGGLFRGAGGENRERLASVNNLFGVASGWDPGADGAINTIARNDQIIVVGGEFTRMGLRGANPNPSTDGQSIPYLAAFPAQPSLSNLHKNAAGHYVFNTNDGDGLGSSVQVQTNDKLGSSDWQTLTTLDILGIQDPYEDATSPATRSRFYRLVRQP